MAQTSFEIDQKTAEALERLKQVYGVQTNAAVLRRALAIALLAAKYADEDQNVHFKVKGPGQGDQEVVVPQRYY